MTEKASQSVTENIIFTWRETEINGIASMEFITTTRGGRQLLRDSYLYYKKKSLNNGSSYWECKERRRVNGCKVKIVLDEQENFSHQFGQHTHAPNPEAVSALKLRSKMKRDARHTHTTTNNIITTNIGGMHEEVLAKLPHIDTIRRDVRRQRAVNRPYPEIPESTLFEISYPYNIRSTGEQFVHYDNRKDDRLIIFETRESYQFPENSENWFMNGTFYTAPPQFAQLYTVHGLSNGKNIVGAYSLLVNKRMEKYEELLSRIHLLTNQVVPGSIMTDFEQFMFGAFK